MSRNLIVAFALAGIVVLAVIAFWNPLASALALAAAVVVYLGNIAARRRSSEPLPLNDIPTSASLSPQDAWRRGPISPSALLDATMNSMREGVLIVDDELRIVASNTSAKDIFEIRDGKLETRRLTDLTRNPSIHDAFKDALDNGARIEVKVEMHSSERRMFDLRVAPLRFGNAGLARGAIGVFFDITQLERLERVRQEFLSNVSHELRTPLTAIIAFVETLEDGAIDDPDNNRRFLKVIRKNSSRMHSLLDDILDLSAIETGKVTVDLLPVSLAAAVDEVNASLASRGEARNVALDNHVGPEVMVHADARRLEQMLTNLVDNAIKFNHDGGKVTVTHESVGSRDRISVIDTGPGIPPEHIERIFERFYRIDRARSREMGGTGLGLAIVKHLARAHGGEATVQSVVGEGSTFSIELPGAMSDNL